MRLEEIRERIVNNPGFQTLEEIKQAGYRIVKERDGERYFLARPEELKPLLVRLGDIAEVRRGFTTGANEFFYLQPLDKTVAEVEEIRKTAPHTPIRVKNGAGWEGEIEASWLRPVIKSPREIKTIRVRLEDLHYLVFMPPDDVREMIKTRKKNCLRTISKQYPLAVHYIQWGEKQGYSKNKTCISRLIWWILPLEKGNTFWAKELRERLTVFISFDLFFADCRLYVAKLDNFSQRFLNSTLSFLIDENNARNYGGGGGPRSVMVYEVKKLVILNKIITHQHSDFLKKIMHINLCREIKNIFEELGFSLCKQRDCDQPNHPYEDIEPSFLTLERVRKNSPDRYELDRIVFDILGLTEEERLAVYRAVVDLVKTRLVKARSV